jgi:uncharacterized membrane protein
MRTDLPRTIGLSAISGSRTMLGPAFVVAEQKRFRRSRAWVYALAATELVMDKMPFIPDRTSLGSLLGRGASGAWVAARGVRGDRSARATAALFGAIAAVGGAFAGHRLRRGLNRVMGGGAIGNALGGALEDGAVLMLGATLARRAR